MAAEDIQAEVLGWALDETSKQCFGEDYGVAVSFTLMPVNAAQMIPVWQLVITAHNPLLGQGPLFHAVPVGKPQEMAANVRPREEAVRESVGEGIRLLRGLARAKLGKSNGAPPKLLSG